MCHSRHHYLRAAPRSDARRSDEPQRRDPGMRASDAERESTVSQLREHGAAGRLELEELEQRIGAAYAARTHGELEPLLRDLPGAPPVRAVAPRRRSGADWAPFLQVSAVLVAIWALSGAGYFWPAWVMIWWGFALVMKAGPGLLRLR